MRERGGIDNDGNFWTERSNMECGFREVRCGTSCPHFHLEYQDDDSTIVKLTCGGQPCIWHLDWEE